MRDATLLLTRSDVERLLDVSSCVAGVEHAFRQRGLGHSSPSGVLGVHVAGGGFHAKAAMLELSRPYFVVKVNANFPANPATRGLPTIQGVLALFDATTGTPLAVMDSMSITTLRTAAASAVAAKYLARDDARTATFVGCGVQARAHVAAMLAVRALERIFVFDVDASKAEHFASQMRELHALDVVVAKGLQRATRESEIVATTTSSTTAFFRADHLSPGAFVAAVGADNEHKHEIDVSLLRASAVVVDDLDQCATIGDLHHALDACTMTRNDVRATLGEVVAGVKPGRIHADEMVVFDSTGVAIEDVAAAAIVFERARLSHAGLEIVLG